MGSDVSREMAAPMIFSLRVLLEENTKAGPVYALPADQSAWNDAVDNHPRAVVCVSLDHLTPACVLQLEVVVISRERHELVIDLAPMLKRDAPSLFTRYRGYAVECDGLGHRVTNNVSQQLWKAAE